MPKPIDRFVSENRRATRRIDSTFIQVSTNRRKQMDFGVQLITVSTTIEVYSRDLNDSLISGHPAAKHGSGRGVSGDRRGSWSLETDTESSEDFTTGGRNNVRDSLDGTATAGIDEIAVGSGSQDADEDDTSLQTQTGRVHAWGIQGSSTDTSLARAIFLFDEYGDAISEAGVYSGGGTLFNRITFSSINPSNEKEIRVDIEFDIDGEGRGDSVITNDGLAAIAESIRDTNSQVGLETMAFGDGTTSPSKSDSALVNKLFDVNVDRLLNEEIVTTLATVFEQEPATQPVNIKEIGVFDNKSRLIWRTLTQTFEKNSNNELEVYAAFRAK